MDWPQLNTVDIVALVVIALGTLNGLRRGLSGEIAGTVSAVVALLLGLLCYGPCGDWLSDHTAVSEGVDKALAFAATIIVALVVMLLLRLMVKETVTVAVSSKKVDLIGGLLAGFVKTTIFVAVVLLCVNMWPNPYLNRVFGDESVIGRITVAAMPELREQAESASEAVFHGE